MERAPNSPTNPEEALVPTYEPLKAVSHGLLLGCILPILAYNVSSKNWFNVMVYAGIIGWEMNHIVGHVRECK